MGRKRKYEWRVKKLTEGIIAVLLNKYNELSDGLIELDYKWVAKQLDVVPGGSISLITEDVFKAVYLFWASDDDLKKKYDLELARGKRGKIVLRIKKKVAERVR